MKKRGGIFFAIAAVIMTVVLWGNPITHVKTAFFPEILVLSTAPISTDFESTVDSDRLMTHVNAVSQPRATTAQKEPIRRYIREQLTAYGLSPIEQRYAHPETGAPDTGGINVIGTLPGTDPNAGILILGAHYDSAEGSPGADDNGSGVATLLEAARLFSPLTQAGANASDNIAASPFPKTLKLVFFDQEERQPDGTGLLGSLAFTQNPVNMSDVEGAIILDMIGYACRTTGCQSYPQGLPLPSVPDTGDFLAVLGLSDHTDLIGAFMGSAQSNWPQVISLPIPKTTLRLFPDLKRSDHAPFWEKDIPAVFVTDTANFRNANYHTARDLPTTLDVSFFRGSAQHVVNATITMLSNAAS
ncbi:MAG: M28 family peptidase [Cyanobacteria bacterium P01_F01_bin.3]